MKSQSDDVSRQIEIKKSAAQPGFEPRTLTIRASALPAKPLGHVLEMTICLLIVLSILVERRRNTPAFLLVVVPCGGEVDLAQV